VTANENNGVMERYTKSDDIMISHLDTHSARQP